MKRLLLAVALLVFGAAASAPAHAQFVKPDNVPTTNVPDYNITLGVWALDSLVGSYVGFFEYHPQDGKWYGWPGNGTQPSINFEQDVANAGGPNQFILHNLSFFNTILANRYPPIGSPPAPPGLGAVSQLNAALWANFTFKAVGGVETIGAK